ncbi:MAG: T9SS type A sorting domain-containing protein [Chitinophagaceae bacterium]|nr:T9SS type A sorting domain-containing protein [Chitinophagaceae bacterium]
MKKLIRACIFPPGILLFLIGSFLFPVTTHSQANNLICAATPITSSPSCSSAGNNVAGSITGATTYTALLGLPGCGVATRNDVWYSFIAQSANPTIVLTTVLANPRLTLFGGTCAAPISLFCGTTSINATGLLVGTTYRIRVYNDPNATGAFNICVIDPPANDGCLGAFVLPVNNSCAKTFSTIEGATPSGIAWPCGVAGGIDLWYRFVAESPNATITTADFGANFINRRIQLFSGSCAGLISLFCVNTNSMAATGLIPGNPYWIRVGSTSTTTPATAGEFSICVFNTPDPQRHGNSYVNLSKRSAGGVVQKGDTLEIRMTINVSGGTCFSPRYLANIPTHTAMLTTTADSIRIITNEGLTFRRYTPLTGDDAASYVPSPLGANQYNIRINLGMGATLPGTPANNLDNETASATGQLIAAGAANKPRGGGGMLFATSFRVRVTGDVDSIINLGASKFVYKTTAGGADVTLSGTPYKILITDPLSLCASATGINSAVESGGTFGSGSTLNRATDLTTPIPGYTFTNSAPLQGIGDGQYSIVKNMSPYSGTNRLAERTPTCPTPMPSNNACANRMHGGHWDVDGDHTGSNNSIGNVPPADATPAGYMLMVNADYVASETYRQTLTNLCPNTYYEFSAWLRNICPTCGIDSTGTTYLPRRPGVLPNLTFSLDSVDRYSTGEVSTASGWVKKGFVFITDSTQTSATFVIRNNSQGGGGNDWVIDDITVATCLPNMNYSPSLNPTVCEGNPLTINDTIRSYFDNYIHYKWQRSTDNGATWTDITAAQTAPPGQENEYITSYTIPPSATTTADSADLYRVIVATTVANLGNTACQVTDGISIINLVVEDCGIPLKTDLLSFHGKLVTDRSHLSWTTSKEDGPIKFNIERSADGNNFQIVGTVNGYTNYTSTVNSYTFIDPQPVSAKAFYRLILVDESNTRKYSRTIQLSRQANAGIGLVNVINPFHHSLEFDVAATGDEKIEAFLVDIFGKVIRKQVFVVHAGINALSLPNTESLPDGAYIFRVKSNEFLINRKVLKKN